ncbi:hypothetical protein BSPWISOXPB_4560 [uncultured Gammaproteobacteria bacterium]|nr:hypothetical protein BSPWISOXPB_4560 [uncultured Gammaproteobacteria bacterium]
MATPKFIQIIMPLPPLKLMGQSRRGVVLEVQVRPLIAVIPRFIQLEVPLSPLKPTAQLQRGVNRIMEALYLHLSLRLIKHRLKIIKIKVSFVHQFSFLVFLRFYG